MRAWRIAAISLCDCAGLFLDDEMCALLIADDLAALCQGCAGTTASGVELSDRGFNGADQKAGHPVAKGAADCFRDFFSLSHNRTVAVQDVENWPGLLIVWDKFPAKEIAVERFNFAKVIDMVITGRDRANLLAWWRQVGPFIEREAGA